MANPETDGAAQEQESQQAFIDKAQDLLQPYFPKDRCETLLHVFYNLLRDDQRRLDDAPLWQESGRDAIRALIGGLDPKLGHDGTRRWAALLEPFLPVAARWYLGWRSGSREGKTSGRFSNRSV